MTTSPHPEVLLRRLRARGVAAWNHADRAERARSVLARLAALDPDAPDRVPALPSRALTDQLAVLYHDAVLVGRADEADDLLRSLLP